MRRAHAMPFGAEMRPDGATRFRLWAPAAARVEVEFLASGARARVPMQDAGAGWYQLISRAAPAGTLYRFILDSGLAVPDPASRHNPLDVHGPSAVLDPHDYAWRDDAWAGRPWEDAVLYELHVGTFTSEGTFAAARARLEELAVLGITAIERMPVADFPGQRNWGYDGVLPFAPDGSYGTLNDLRAFIDRARLRLLAHFGAEPVTVPHQLAGGVIYCAGASSVGDGSLNLEPGAVHVVIVTANA